MSEMVELDFWATIRMPVTPEIEMGDLAQAVQNEVGHAGVQVITAELIDESADE